MSRVRPASDGMAHPGVVTPHPPRGCLGAGIQPLQPHRCVPGFRLPGVSGSWRTSSRGEGCWERAGGLPVHEPGCALCSQGGRRTGPLRCAAAGAATFYGKSPGHEYTTKEVVVGSLGGSVS